MRSRQWIDTGVLARSIERRGEHRRSALRERLSTLLTALERPPDRGAPTRGLLAELESALGDADPRQIWLSLAVLGGELPDHAAVLAATRAARLDGPLHAVKDRLRALRPGWPLARGGWPGVEIVSERVVVDVHHTSQTSFATGIQRVARQSAVRWARDHDPVFIGWNRGYTHLRRLSHEERERAIHGGPDEAGRGEEAATVLVPWRCTYVLPELLAEVERARLLQAMVEFSGSHTAVIGFDCVPLTSAETTARGMSGGFALNLCAVAQMDRVATISGSAAAEYRGWRTMLSGTGVQGPAILPISLPVEAEIPSPDALSRARELLTTGHQPMVLVVGSHEPRKNHQAVLHAAELLWREGLRFNLNFVGGNSWNSERFSERLAALQAQNRPIQSISALPDDLLWASYRLARCVLFPSLNEGFGLPVAESLASGTPVITSNFGSMREIAASGGSLLVDPRDDHAIAAALRVMLTDDALHARLSAEARSGPRRTWDEYAEEAWQYLVNGVQPPADAIAMSAAAGGE